MVPNHATPPHTHSHNHTHTTQPRAARARARACWGPTTHAQHWGLAAEMEASTRRLPLWSSSRDLLTASRACDMCLLVIAANEDGRCASLCTPTRCLHLSRTKPQLAAEERGLRTGGTRTQSEGLMRCCDVGQLMGLPGLLCEHSFSFFLSSFVHFLLRFRNCFVVPYVSSVRTA